MAEEYKIVVGAELDEGALSGLQSKISGLSSSIKPIKLKLDTSNVESQIKSIKTQIEALSNIKINLGAGKSRGGVASISQETAAYKQLLSVASQLDKLTLKTGSMKVAGADISEVQAKITQLRSTYQSLYNQLSAGNLSKAGFKNLTADISTTQASLTKLEAELVSMQSKLSAGIKLNISNGTLGNQIAQIESQFNALGIKSDEVSAHIEKLKSLMSTMDASDDIESVVADYETFKNTLVTVTNQVKALQREQKAANAATTLEQSRTALSSQIDSWLTRNSAAAKQFGAQLADIKARIATADATSLGHLKAEFQEVTRQANIAGVATQSMGDKFKAQMSKLGTYFSASMLIMRGIQTVRSMYNEVLSVDTAMTGLYRVTNMSQKSYGQLYDGLVSSAQRYGATLSDIIDLTTSWVKLGYDPSMAKSLAEITTMYQHVADIDTTTATKNLITAYKGFQETLDQTYNGDAQQAVSYIADIYDKLNNEFAVTAADIGAAMERSASALQMGGNTIQEATGLATGMTEVLQNAEKSGTVLSVTSLRLRGMKGELEALGEEVDENIESVSKLQTHILNLTHGKVNIFQDNGDFKSTYQILKEISNIWDNLKDTEQADLLESIAGREVCLSV